MPSDDLNTPFFLVGLAVTVAVAGVSQAGWKHRLLIVALFLAAGLLFVMGIGWHWLKDLSPAATAIVTSLTGNPVAWFVIIMFALSTIIYRSPKYIASSNPIPATFAINQPTASIYQADIAHEITVFVHEDLAKFHFIPAQNFDRLRIRLDQSMYAENLLVGGNLWPRPVSTLLADLTDVVRGVYQTVPLMEKAERPHPQPNQPTLKVLRWANSKFEIQFTCLHRIRIVLLADGVEEQAYPFFVIFHRMDGGGSSIRIIGEKQIAALHNWDTVRD